MKCVCTQENFKKAVFDTERVTGKQKTLPILSNLLMEVEKGRIRLSGTNLEIGIISQAGAKVEEEGRLTIPAKILSSFVNNLPTSDTVVLEADDQNLSVTCGTYKAKIKGISAQEFPIIPKVEGDFMFSVSAAELKESLTRVLVCVSPNETRPELTGVNMLFSEKEIIMAGTDSFRLAETVLKLSDEKSERYQEFIGRVPSIIVPSSTLSEITRIITPTTEKVKFAIEENQIFFEIDNVQVVSRLINGKYPPYKQIMPQEFSTRAVLGKEEIGRALKIASAFSGNKSSGEVKIRIDAQNKEVVVFSQSQDTGENQSSLKADVTGPDQEIIFNPRYLSDGINSVASPQIAFLSNSATTPAAIRMIDGEKGLVMEDYTYIVMPIKN